MPTQDTIKKVVCDVVKNYDVKEAYLFGSYARGEEKELEERLSSSIEIISAPPKELHPRFYDRIKQDEVMLYAS